MLRSLMDVLFPPTCCGCGALLTTGEEELCLQCISDLPRSHYIEMGDDHPMVERFAGIFPFPKAVSWLLYADNGLAANLIMNFKYRRMPQLARRMGSLMAQELSYSGFFASIDAIQPMPQHWSRRLHRGYNQTEYIAEGISSVTDIPVIDNLRAIRRHRTQTALTLEQRRGNLKGSFTLRHPEELSDMHILLIDDVCTTGATMMEAALTIHDANPTVKFSILTIASTV